MWIKIRTVLIAVLLNQVTLKALATGAGLKVVKSQLYPVYYCTGYFYYGGKM